jgi:hypothetical protein
MYGYAIVRIHRHPVTGEHSRHKKPKAAALAGGRYCRSILHVLLSEVFSSLRRGFSSGFWVLECFGNGSKSSRHMQVYTHFNRGGEQMSGAPLASVRYVTRYARDVSIQQYQTLTG